MKDKKPNNLRLELLAALLLLTMSWALTVLAIEAMGVGK